MRNGFAVLFAVCAFIVGWATARFLAATDSHVAAGRTLLVPEPFEIPITRLKEGEVAAASGDAKVSAATQPPPGSELASSMRSAIADPDKLRKQRAVLDLLEYLTPENAPAVRDVFLAFRKPGAKEDFAWSAFWTRWGQIDGLAALEYVTAAHPELGGSGAGTNVMEGLVGTDSTVVRKWLNAHLDLPVFDVFARVYVENLARTNLSMATHDLFAFPLEPEERYSCFGPIVKEALLSGGINGVEGWFRELNDFQKKEAFIHAVWAIKDADLNAVTSWYSAQADKPWRNDKHLDDIVRSYAERDPAASIEWLLSLPPSPQIGPFAGLPMAVDVWARNDPASAATWLLQNVNQPWFPKAASGYVRTRGIAAETELFRGIDSARRQAVIDQLRN